MSLVSRRDFLKSAFPALLLKRRLRTNQTWKHCHEKKGPCHLFSFMGITDSLNFSSALRLWSQLWEVKHVLFLSRRAFSEPPGLLWLQMVGDRGKRGKSSRSETKAGQLVAAPPHSHTCTCVPKPPTAAPEVKKKTLLCSRKNKKCDHPAWEGQRKIITAGHVLNQC